MKSLRLVNFRNYGEQGITPGPGMNVIHGPNAQGKTNLLEAINYLCLTKPIRSVRDSDLVRFGSSFLAVRGTMDTRFAEYSVELTYVNPGQKKLSVNGEVQRKVSDYIGTTPVVTFVPDDLQMVKAGPNLRRRFIDILLSQSDKAYCHNLGQYNKVLKQRNAVLKNRGKGLSGDELEPWSRQLADFGAAIMHHRLGCLEALGHHANQTMRLLSDGKEILTIGYDSALVIPPGADCGQIGELLYKGLSSISREECLRGTTLLGPHRDDLDVSINGERARNYGSQGQQRSCVLALKMAEIRYLTDSKGEAPIILLDDVLSELDSDRQRRLLGGMVDCSQTFVTTTGNMVDGSLAGDDTMYFNVVDGHLQ